MPSKYDTVDNNDSKHCLSVINIAYQMIIYKRWLNKIYNKSKPNQDIDTVHVDIASITDLEIIKTCIIESAKDIKHKKWTNDHFLPIRYHKIRFNPI